MIEKRNDASLENGEKVPALWGWHTYLSIAIAVVILVGLASMVDLDRIWREVAACEKKFLLLGLLAHYATYPLRGLRWRRCLMQLPIKCGKAKFGLLVFFYNAVDNVVPAKLGDVYGAHLARINCGIRRSAAMGSLVFLRMVDAWVVLALALPASWSLFSDKFPRAVILALTGGGIIAFILTFIMLIFFLLKRSLPRWLPEKIQQIIRAFHTAMWPRPSETIPIAALTLGIWALETLWIFLLALAFGLKLSPAEAVFLTMIPLLASAFPITPSGAGVVEITMFTCLRIVGVSSALAVSVTAANRFIDYWLHIGLGLLIWAIKRRLGLRALRDVPVEDLHGANSLKTLVGQEDLL